MESALTVDQQHPALTRFRHSLGHAGVVSMTSYRGDRAGKMLSLAKLTELKSEVMRFWIGIRQVWRGEISHWIRTNQAQSQRDSHPRRR